MINIILKAFKLTTLLFIFTTVFSSTVEAAKTPASLWDTTNALTVSNAANNQTDVMVVPDGGTGSILIWTDERTGVGVKQVYAQRLDSDGVAMWTANGMYIAEGKLNFAVADGSGGAYIYYNSNELQRITNTGTLWGSPTTLFSGFTGEMTTATSDAMVDNDGNFLVVRSNASHYHVQKVNNLGVLQFASAGTQITTTTTNTRPKIATDGEGGIFVVMDNTASGIVAQHVDSTGLKLFANDGVAIRAGSVDYPGIVHDGVDGAFIVFKESTTGKLQRINYSGVLQFAAAGVSLTGSWTNAADPTILSDGSGGVVVNYNGGLLTNRRNSTGGAVWNASATIVSHTNPGKRVAVTSDSVYVVGKRNPTNYICVYQYNLAAGTAIQSCTAGLDGSTQGNTSIDPTVMAYSNNDIVVAWSDGKISTSDRNILAQRQGTGYQILTTMSVLSQYNKNIRTTSTGTTSGGINSANGRVYLNNVTTPPAILNVAMTQDRDWTGVSFSSTTNSFFAGNLSSADGFIAFESVLVRKFDSLYICPDATTADAVWPGCSNQVVITGANADVSIVNISGNDYWQINNFVSGGAVSLGTYTASSFEIVSEPVAEEDAYFTFTITPLNSLGELDTGYQGYINVNINAPSFLLDQNNFQYTNYDESTGEVIMAWSEIHDPGDYTITVSDGTVSSSLPITVVPRITNNALDYDFNISGDVDGSCLGCDSTHVRIADFNDDGMDDIAVLSEVNNNNIRSLNIIFGNNSTIGTQSLANTSSYNLRIDPDVTTGTFTGMNVADFDNDGKMDIAINAPNAGYNSLAGSGSMFIILGDLLSNYDSTTGNVISTSSSSSYNVRFDGALVNETLGDWWEGGAPFIEDYNNDNSFDILIPNSQISGNSVYVIDNSIITANGFSTGITRHLATSSNYTIKYSLAAGSMGYYNGYMKDISVGDANGDGFTDLVLGSEDAGDTGDGAIYFIDSSLLLDLATTTGNDKSLDVSTNYTVKYMGLSPIETIATSAIEDVNGDGLGDLIMGSAYGYAEIIDAEGMVFVVFSTLLDDYTTTGNSIVLNNTAAYNVRVVGGPDDMIDLTHNAIQDWDGDGFKDLTINSIYGYNHWLYKTGYAAIIYADTLQALGNSTGNDYFVGQYDSDFDLKITSDVYYHQPKMSGEHTDVDGDGLIDMFFIGHGSIIYPDSTGDGAAYVISGTKIQSWGKTGRTIHLTNPDNFDRRYEGVMPQDDLGGWNGGMYSGDFNGDSYKDIFILSGYVGAQNAESLYVDLGEAPPIPPTSITIDSPFIKVETGNSISITVTARDENGDPLTSYTGTVSFESSDGGATLPADYTFVSGDNGEHTFDDIEFSTPGDHTITVTDEGTGTVIGEYEIEVVDTAGLSLGDPANYDLRIDGVAEDFCLSCWDNVIAAGDINGDGIDDLILHGYETVDYLEFIYIVFGGDSARVQDTNLANPDNYNIKIELNGVLSEYVYGINIGDINSDGETDLLVTSGSSDNNGTNTGSTYIFYSSFLDQFSSTTGNTLITTELTDFSLRIDGDDGDMIGGRDGWPVIADYNNDNQLDLIIGSYRSENGLVYLIDSSIISSLGSGVGNILDLGVSTNYSVKYTHSGDLGYSTVFRNRISVNDFNNDGDNDLVISNESTNSGVGAHYLIDSSLIPSGSTGNILDIENNVNYTAIITHSTLPSNTPLTSTFLSDVNGDGSNDLIISPQYNANTSGFYVLFSSMLDDLVGTGNSLDLNNAASYNARINISTDDNAKISPQGFADWNDDGDSDLVISAPSHNGSTGAVYILHSTIFETLGLTTGNSLDLGNSSDFSVRIDGIANNHNLDILGSYRTTDLTGDGKPDLILTQAGSNFEGDSSGSIYIMNNEVIQTFGATPGEVITLTNPSNFSYRYDGPSEDIELTDWGQIVPGDFNGGGIDDLIIGNYNTSYNGDYSGSVWIIFSDETPSQPTEFVLTNLTPPLNAVLQSDINVDVSTTPQIGDQNIRLRENNIPLADISANFDSERNWSSVVGDSDISEKKSYVNNLHNAPGANGTYSLYVPKGTGDNRVYICPNVTSLVNISLACSGGSASQNGDSGISIVTIDSQDYWKIDNQTGNVGAMSYTYSAPVDPTPDSENPGEDTEEGTTTNNNVGNSPDTTDTDGDGLTDEEENEIGTNPNDPDSDGDGLTDGFEVDNSGPEGSETELDPLDIDSDNDGVNDGSEDFDDDGLTNEQEQNLGTDPNNPDTDNNGTPDGEEDSDTDGLSNEFESDNPGSGNTTLDPTSPDSNNNGIPDSEEDYDNDGLTNAEEEQNGTNPYIADTDGDGLLDGEEVRGCIFLEGTTECSSVTFNPTDPTDSESVYIPISEEINSNEALETDGSFLNSIQKVVESIVEAILNVLEVPLTAVRISAQNGTLPVALIASTTSSLGLTAVAYPHVFTYFFVWFKRKKKINSWGTIYDSITNKPIAFATLRVMSENNEFIAGSVTDLNGKYSLNLPIGNYLTLVRVNGYADYSKVNELNSDIALTSISAQGFNIRQFFKTHLSRINSTFFYVGVVLSVLAVIYAPSIINVLVLFIFIIQSVIHLRVKGSNSGSVIDQSTGQSLKGIFIRIFNAEGRQIGSTVTDAKGKYNVRLMPGKYIVKVEGLDYEMIEDSETSKDALGNTYFVVEMKKEELLNIEIPMKRKRNISPDINPNKFGYLAS